VLAFALGCLTAWLFRFFFSGTPVSLSAEAFVSLVFTVAVGAASLVLAVLAINFGRLSERIITERADKSIDIQMRLFEKSLALQTQLFDKTMSTLEAIGRSTGVTEQRLGDLHSLLQSPELRKQVAGRAVDELRAGGKGTAPTQLEPELAERITKNVVRELARSLERSEPVREPHRVVSRPAEQEDSFEETIRKEKEKGRRRQQREAIERQISQIVKSLPGAKELPKPPDAYGFWDLFFEHDGKRVAVDIRTPSSSDRFDRDTYDDSIKLVVSSPADYLLFVFTDPPGPKLVEHIARRNSMLEGRIKTVVASAGNLRESIEAILRG